MEDPVKKEATFETFTAQWLKRDTPAATAWLNASSLPQDSKDRLLKGNGASSGAGSRGTHMP